jgi:hypothetical protein
MTSNGQPNPINDKIQDTTKLNLIVNQIDFEINEEKQRAKKPGWTTWAILAAIAYLVSYFFNTIEANKNINWVNIFILITLFSIIFDFLFFFRNSLRSPTIGHSKIVRYESSKSAFQTGRLLLFVVLLRNCLLIALTYYFSIIVSAFCVTLVRIYLYSVSSMILIGLILSLFHLPLPSKLSSKFDIRDFIFELVLFVIMVAPILWLGAYVLYKSMAPSIPEIKIGLVVTSISILIMGLSRLSTNSQYVPRLIQLRRSMLLEKLSHESALEQLDLIIHGLTLGEILSPQITAAIDSLNELQNELDVCLRDYNVLDKLIDKEPKEISDDNRILAESLIQSIHNKLKRANELREAGNKRVFKLLNKLKIVEMLSDEVSTEIDKIIKILKKSLDEILNKLETMLQNIDKTQNRLSNSTSK